LSFEEDTSLEVYDTSDPEWTLVAHKGEFGFAPANYIEVSEEAEEHPPQTPARPRPVVSVPEPEPEPEAEPDDERGLPTPSSSTSPVHSPAAALAGILAHKTGAVPLTNGTRSVSSPPLPTRPVQYTPEESEEEAPAPRLPRRPPSETVSPPATRYESPREPEPAGVIASPPYRRATSQTQEDDEPVKETRGFHIYNIYEMVEVMGKNKKMPITLGINPAKGVIMISPESSRDSKEWTAEKLTHYSIEGKHVFMELVRPSKSVDFHAGAKDTAQEIVAMLGDLAGAVRAEGLREVLTASSGPRQKKAKMLYDFMAQGDDEVTVAAEDDVIVLEDDNEEWWLVRRLKNGKEGVVPSKYVEITGTIEAPASMSGLNAGKSFVEQNRIEEERLAKQAAKSHKRDEVGPGMQLPQRGSSLMRDDDKRRPSQKSKRESRDGKTTEKKSSKSITRRFEAQRSQTILPQERRQWRVC